MPRGAGTGLSGGARPSSDGVLLGLSKLSRIIEIDPDNRIARVEPGVRNLAISEAAARYGLYYAPDPSSQIACSIGGNVAENSGGVHCLKYGLTVHNVLGLKLLTLEGDELTIGGATLDSPGYDLLALFTGSEGMLGIVTEVTVRLLPIPATKRLMLAAFASLEAAAGTVGRIIANGIIPAGLEMMDARAIAAAEAFVGAGYPTDAAAILLCELDGTHDEVEEQSAQVLRLMRAQQATEVRASRDDADRERMWLGRKAAFPAVGRLAPDYYCMDGTIPRARLARSIARHRKTVGAVRAGCGERVPCRRRQSASADPVRRQRRGELERAEKMGGEILALCVAVGGTVTGEHGVGVEKLDAMCGQFAAPELEQFHRLKAAFDPAGLMNPGKAVPTLARCAEIGGMHVHKGKIAFPEIERF